jgi:hypothetical protein
MRHFFLQIIYVFFLFSGFLQAETTSSIPELPKNERLLLIIGCARSGTTYIAQVLNKNGFNAIHERIGRHGAVSWCMTFDNTRVPMGDARNGMYFHHIFHQVRHPLKVISSAYTTEPKESWSYIMKCLPQIRKTDSHLTKCAKYWYFWNLKAEEQAEWTYRIEDIENQWEEFQVRLGIVLPEAALHEVPKNTNTRPHEFNFTWRQLRAKLDPVLYNKIREMTLRYGYSLEGEGSHRR